MSVLERKICLLLIIASLCFAPLALAQETAESERLLNVLQELKTREQSLDFREAALQEEEKRIGLLRHELQLKQQEIEDLKNKVETMFNDFKALKDEDLSRLVEVYTAMKPDAAAPLLSRLELKYAVEIILRMPAKKSAKLLSAVETDRAALISRAITEMEAPE